MVDGNFREFHQRTPLRRIIDIFVERQTVVEAVDQAVVHYEIHSAVTADLAGKVLYLPGYGVLEYGEQRIPLCVAHILLGIEVVRREYFRSIAPEGEARGGIFVGIALRPDNLIHPVVGAGGHDIVLYEDSLAVMGTDQGRSQVTVFIFHGTLTVAFVSLGLAGEGPGIHRHQFLHPVAPVDAEHLADGADAVGRIHVTVVIPVVGHTPVALIIVPPGVEVVVIGALYVDHVPEEPLLSHIKAGQFEKVVAAVLQHYAMLAGPLGSVHQGPALFDAGRSRHLNRNVLAVLHGIGGHSGVHLPGNGQINEIDIVKLAKLLPSLLSGELVDGFGSAPFHQATLGTLNPFGQ